jgi:hypothetical protein
MGPLSGKQRRRPLPAAAGLLAVVAACSAGGGTGAGAGADPRASGHGFPVTAEINQLRDNYANGIVSVQLTNTSGAVLTVLEARLGSALFAEPTSWQPAPGGIDLPPGQAKSLPARLSAPVCTAAGREETPPTVSLRLAPAAETAPELTLAAADPYGVLSRNNAEMCVSLAADAVAELRLHQDLEVYPDGQTAVVRLLATPRKAGTAAAPGSLTILRVEGTPLLAEDPAAPWPVAVAVQWGGPSSEYRLGIRPARCDPHAVAEDKVGTLLPLRVAVAGREGVLKVDAGPLLRGRIHDFVTAACGRQ